MSHDIETTDIRRALHRGCVIPAHPLALTASRQLDERRQRALSRYYIAAGAGGLAVGVHTTQFEIRDPSVDLYKPVLELAMEVMSLEAPADFIRIAGICGRTSQAEREASFAASCGYHAGLLSLAALQDATDDALIEHCHRIASIIPVVGFYLQPSVGGRILGFDFWRKFVDIENVVAIKIAPFNRYQTIDVVRALHESGNSSKIALYTGNDDNIIIDLLTKFQLSEFSESIHIKGGLLGHWAVWAQKAVSQLKRCRAHTDNDSLVPHDMITLAFQVTDSNAALFDPSHNFAGCIAGIHEVLRRQGLLDGIWCLNPNESLSPGQSEEIDRVYTAYPHLNDDLFVAEHREKWLTP
ncbi:MAG: dihydrodipicolinate synthase family protein [Gemmatimonadota bacterium]|nr:dihydrodipicolinate synthase family protein [Gemmatimonadota bacterium]